MDDEDFSGPAILGAACGVLLGFALGYFVHRLIAEEKRVARECAHIESRNAYEACVDKGDRDGKS